MRLVIGAVSVLFAILLYVKPQPFLWTAPFSILCFAWIMVVLLRKAVKAFTIRPWAEK